MRSTTMAALVLALASCASTGTPARSGPPGAGASVPADTVPPGVVDGATAHRLVLDEDVKVVDVRTQAEFAAGHVPGALNIPYDELPRRHGEIGAPSTPVLVYCQSGRRSAIAGSTLRERGFTRVYDLQAYERWVASEEAPLNTR